MATPLLGIRCLVLRNTLDRRLAHGADVESSECLHRRAAELTRESSRRALAAAYERHLAAATAFPQLDVLRVNWRGLREARPRLERLVERLREDPNVSARGVARARLLLHDRDGPLYRADDLGLAHEVRSTLALL